MKVAYIAGPYSSKSIAGVVRNIREAERIAIQWWHHGFAVICPHMNTALLDGEIDYETFMEGDLEFVRRADLIVMMPGWRNSAGAAREHALAEELGKRIVYV
jgi:uncharacterized protein DUF4406